MSLDDFKKPAELTFQGNICDKWRAFENSLSWFLIASDLDRKSAARKVAILLNLIGEEGRHIFESFCLENAEKQNYDLVLGRFRDYCTPCKNIVFERFKLFNRPKRVDETFDSWTADLRRIAQTGEYGDLKDALTLVQIVSGIGDEKLQERLLEEKNLTLKKAEELIKAKEVAYSQVKMMRKPPDNLQINTSKIEPEIFQMRDKNYAMKPKTCWRCGKPYHKYFPKDCPAMGKICSKCGGRNHLAIRCRRMKPQIHAIAEQVEEEYINDETDIAFLG